MHPDRGKLNTSISTLQPEQIFRSDEIILSHLQNKISNYKRPQSHSFCRIPRLFEVCFPARRKHYCGRPSTPTSRLSSSSEQYSSFALAACHRTVSRDPVVDARTPPSLPNTHTIDSDDGGRTGGRNDNGQLHIGWGLRGLIINLLY